MVLRSCRNAQRDSIGHSNQDTPVPTPALAKYTKEDLQNHEALYRFVLPDVGQSTERSPRSTRTTSLPPWPLAPTTPLFAASFLRGRISFCWHQYKRRKNQAVEDPLPWVEFKAFLRKSPSDSRAFVDIIWSRRSLQLGVSPQAFPLSSLMLMGLQKSPTSFDSFEKDSSPRSRPRWNNAEGNLTVGTHISRKSDR